tara:strand:+ start:281 stop:529 length:249 start_codon:yes stop_codon:yes gene_type:complete
MLDKLKRLDFLITNLEALNIEAHKLINTPYDSSEIDKLKMKSNELKIALGIIENSQDWRGKNIYWKDVKFLKSTSRDQKKRF